MYAYIVIASAVAFWMGIKVSRLLSVTLNKHYARSFYVPRTIIQLSVIGDYEGTGVAIAKHNEDDCEVVHIEAYGFDMVMLSIDAQSLRADAPKTLMCLHDFAVMSPMRVRFDEDSGKTKIFYQLPRKLSDGQKLRVWFFN